RRWLPAPAESVLAGCDAVLHAGDVVDKPTLERIADTAAAGGARPPVYAVLGNNDTDLAGTLPPVRHVDLGGVRVAMIHDSGPTRGRAGRLRRRFPDAQLVVFGHSHAPLDDEGLDGQRLFNPGSPTQRRAQPRHTLGELHLGGGAIVGHRIIAID
ncbi:MAG: metallophosphoesterase family protein, partial [Actinomycetota bacterium]|nr:metallophosphoesterase family protein [Actinomycetota bacterium]